MNGSINVLYFAGTNDKNGGSLHSLVDIARRLKTEGHVNPFVVLPGHGSGEELLKEYGIPYIAVKNYGSEWPLGAKKTIRSRLSHFRQRLENKRAIRIVSALAKKIGVELIHINTSTNEMGFYVARKLHVPFIWHIREFIDMSLGLEFYSPRKVYRHMSKAYALVTISSMLCNHYTRILPKQRVLLVHNGIDETLFYDEHNGDYSGQPLTIAMIGRLSKLKGYYDVVDALALISDRNIRVLIMGSGDEGFVEYARQKGVANKLQLLGYQHDVRPFLKEAQVYISAHRWEAFGRATVEAMLSGCCVIGVNNAGTKDLIIDGESGFLFPMGDVARLADIIAYVDTHREAACKCGENAVARAKELFTLSALCHGLYKIYSSAIDSCF